MNPVPFGEHPGGTVWEMLGSNKDLFTFKKGTTSGRMRVSSIASSFVLLAANIHCP
jgi:hypothetical protein